MNQPSISGRRLSAIMADHDRGPEYALVECIEDDCNASARLEHTAGTSTEELIEQFRQLGWSVKPTLCPLHTITSQKGAPTP